jgi:hypothetical protein
MDRSHWPSRVLFIVTALIITASVLGHVLHVRADSNPSRGKLFVMIQGLNTRLQNSTPPAESFGAGNGITSYLSSAYPGAQFLMYSYNGDNADGSPSPYQCQDTFVTDAKADVLKLAKQVGDYLKDKTNMDVYLVSHSFGGLIAFGYLSYIFTQHITNGSIPRTTGDRIAGVVTLDAPLGGIPNNLFLAKLVMSYAYVNQCPRLQGNSMTTIDALFAIYKTGKLLPHGGNNSVTGVLFQTSVTNQIIAAESARQGIQILSIGNSRDYLFNPATCKLLLGQSLVGTENYLSTQWLSDKGNGSGIYGHYFTNGKSTCNQLTDLGVNHGFVFVDRNVQAALGQFVNNEPVTALPIPTPGM